MIQTITIYIGIVIYMCMCFHLSSKFERSKYKRKRIVGSIFYWLSIIGYSAIFGMRYYVGRDYANYLEVYETMGYEVLRFEPGFLLLTVFCYNNNFHYSIYFGIIAFIQASFFFGAFRKNKEILPFLVVVIMLSGIVQTNWMSTMRQSTAMCIFVFALSFFTKQNVKAVLSYLFFVTIAAMFHYSALVYLLLPLYFHFLKHRLFLNIKITISILAFLFIFQMSNLKSVFFPYLESLVASSHYENYTEIFSSSHGANLGVFDIITFFMFCLFVIYRERVKHCFSSDDLFNVIYDVGILGIVITYLMSGSVMLTRIAFYLYLVTYALFAYYFCYFYRNRTVNYLKKQYLVFCLFFFLSFARLMINMQDNSTQFAFYFQDELRTIKEAQRDRMPINVD